MKLRTSSRIDINIDKKNRDNQNVFFEIDRVEITNFNSYNVSGMYYFRKGEERNYLPERLNFSLRKKEVDNILGNFTSAEAKFIDRLEEALYTLSIPYVNADWGVELFQINKSE